MTTTMTPDTCWYCGGSIRGDENTNENRHEKQRYLLLAFPVCRDCLDIYDDAKRDKDKDTLRLFDAVRDTLKPGLLRTKMILLQQALGSDRVEKQRLEEERAFKAAVAMRLNSQTLRLRQAREEDEAKAACELEEFLSEHPEYVDYFDKKKEKMTKPPCSTCIHFELEDYEDEDYEDGRCEEEVCYVDRDISLGKAGECSFHESEDD